MSPSEGEGRAFESRRVRHLSRDVNVPVGRSLGSLCTVVEHDVRGETSISARAADDGDRGSSADRTSSVHGRYRNTAECPLMAIACDPDRTLSSTTGLFRCGPISLSRLMQRADTRDGNLRVPAPAFGQSCGLERRRRAERSGCRTLFRYRQSGAVRQRVDRDPACGIRRGFGASRFVPGSTRRWTAAPPDRRAPRRGQGGPGSETGRVGPQAMRVDQPVLASAGRSSSRSQERPARSVFSNAVSKQRSSTVSEMSSSIAPVLSR